MARTPTYCPIFENTFTNPRHMCDMCRASVCSTNANSLADEYIVNVSSILLIFRNAIAYAARVVWSGISASNGDVSG